MQPLISSARTQRTSGRLHDVRWIFLLLAACQTPPVQPPTTPEVVLGRVNKPIVRAKLGEFPPPPEACNDVGDVETRLYGEPGLTELRPAWSELAEAAHALQAVCGQDALLLQPATGSLAVESARERWRAGQQREMGVACDHLRAAATALGRDAPC